MGRCLTMRDVEGRVMPLNKVPDLQVAISFVDCIDSFTYRIQESTIIKLKGGLLEKNKE
jgi:hypothetical protein